MRSSLSLKALAFAAAAFNGVRALDVAKLHQFSEMVSYICLSSVSKRIDPERVSNLTPHEPH